MIRVLIVDDHAVVRRGLETLLTSADNIEVVGTAVDGIDALRRTASLQPDVILMDLSMPHLDGIESTRRLLVDHPNVRVVALTSFAEQRKVFDAISAGAIGYLLKDSNPEDLIAGVRAAYAGGSPLDPKAARVLVDARRDSTEKPTLSPRETEVLRVVAKGLSNKHIARQLGIGERTVKAHLTAVFQKIGVTDRTSAAMWAKDHLPED
jgi:DNA-binding NarL/FixJ family response regulator